MSTNIAKNNPMIGGSLEKNIFEHISLMALEQVELEFAKRITANTNDITESTSCTESTNATTSSIFQMRLKLEKQV
jgi:glutamate-1-semialdehyde aminotransferase